MRFFMLVMLMNLLSQTTFAQKNTPEEKLGQSLVSAISENDIVSYSQCWLSIRRGDAMMKELGIPEKESKGLRGYLLKRNKRIVDSFRKIQKLIDDKKIDRKSIKLKSCEASNVRKRKAPKGQITNAHSFNVIMLVGQKEWRLKINNGVLDGGMWYFSDSPINLYAGKEILSFHGFRKREPRK